MKKAIYPGSFDPPTNGHLDMIERASKIMDVLVVGVLDNPSKKSLFTVEERVEQLKAITKHIENVEVIAFNGLLIDFCKQSNINIVIRGLRAFTDFEYEFRMALTNKKISETDIETIFFPTDTDTELISSSIVKEIAQFGGPFETMVPDAVREALNKKFRGDN